MSTDTPYTIHTVPRSISSSSSCCVLETQREVFTLMMKLSNEISLAVDRQQVDDAMMRVIESNVGKIIGMAARLRNQVNMIKNVKDVKPKLQPAPKPTKVILQPTIPHHIELPSIPPLNTTHLPSAAPETTSLSSHSSPAYIASQSAAPSAQPIKPPTPRQNLKRKINETRKPPKNTPAPVLLETAPVLCEPTTPAEHVTIEPRNVEPRNGESRLKVAESKAVSVKQPTHSSDSERSESDDSVDWDAEEERAMYALSKQIDRVISYS